MHEIPRYCLKVLLKLANPCPDRKKATAKASPITVRFDPSTKADPWNINDLFSHPLHINQTLRLPPRPVGSTLETTRIPGNESKENITIAKGSVETAVIDIHNSWEWACASSSWCDNTHFVTKLMRKSQNSLLLIQKIFLISSWESNSRPSECYFGHSFYWATGMLMASRVRI